MYHHPAVTVLSERGLADAERRSALTKELNTLLTRGQGDARLHAALVLASWGDTVGTTELSQRLVDTTGNPIPRSLAAFALAQFPRQLDPGPLRTLIAPWVEPRIPQPISQEDEPVVVGLAYACVLAERTQPTFDPTVDPITVWLARAPLAPLRRAAALAFAGRPWSPIPPMFRSLLDDPDPTVRQSALASCLAQPTLDAQAITLRMVHDTDPAVSRDAVVGLASFPGPQVTQKLSELIDAPSATVRQAVMQAAGRLGLEPLVLQGADDRQSDVRMSAAEALASIRSPSAGETLARLLREDRASVVQAAALHSLSTHPAESAVPILFIALESASVQTRTQAARYLAIHLPSAAQFHPTDSPEARAQAIEALRSAWNQRSAANPANSLPNPAETSWTSPAFDLSPIIEQALHGADPMRENALARLAHLQARDRAAVETYFLERDVLPSDAFVTRVLASLDPSYQTLWELLRSTAATRGDRATSFAQSFDRRPASPLQIVLITSLLLQHAEPDLWRKLVPVVLSAPVSVGAPVDPWIERSAEALAVAGLRHPDDTVREMICTHLGKRPVAATAELLARLMNDPSERVRRAAIAAAGATAGADSVQSLRDALRSPSPAIQLEAAAQLLKQGDAEGFQSLRRLFASPDVAIRTRVVDELAQSPDVDREGTLRLLTQALADDKLEVRDKASHALERVVGDAPDSQQFRRDNLGERIDRWKRTMADYFNRPDAPDRLKQFDRLRDLQESMSVLPVAN
jgi:HEAT repeat protein